MKSIWINSGIHLNVKPCSSFCTGHERTKAGFGHYVDLFDTASERIERLADSNTSRHSVLTSKQIDQFWSKRLVFSWLPPEVDGTPAYLWDYDGWENIRGNKGLEEPRYILAHAIRKLVPEAKIIVILRQPSERQASPFPILSKILSKGFTHSPRTCMTCI
jgi:N-acetylgalactosamine 4-sulfate 6-O-sulfotransferase